MLVDVAAPVQHVVGDGLGGRIGIGRGLRCK